MPIRAETKAVVKWGERYGISKPDTLTLRALVNRYVRCQVYAMNGDPHSDAKNREDKDECGRLWERDANRIAVRLMAFANKCGFNEIDFAPGLRPVFRKGGVDDMIMVPE